MRGGRAYLRTRWGTWRPLRRVIRRFKVMIRGRPRWVYHRKRLFWVYYKRRGRPIRIWHGIPRIYFRRRWIKPRRGKTARIRLMIDHRWRSVRKRHGRWLVRYLGVMRPVFLRGRQFGIRIGGRWRYIPSRHGALQIRHGRVWRRVRNCCNRLRAVINGRLRRVRFRSGRVVMRGKHGWTRIQRKSYGALELGSLRGIDNLFYMMSNVLPTKRNNNLSQNLCSPIYRCG